jgi:aspartate-semialdehyde dehydrogenase
MNVAIVGATGAVGEEMLLCLRQRQFPASNIRLLASFRSKGRMIPFGDRQIEVEELTESSFGGVDVALFSAGGSISKQFAPHAAKAGAVVIDNSSAFRADPDVPLVVPEINGEAAFEHPRNIIANPNCTTIITLMAVAPLHRAFGAEALWAASYQAVSGSGAQGIHELATQLRQAAAGEDPTPKVYSRPIISNVIPLIGPVEDNGYTQEEMKMQSEGRKILGQPGLLASATCVRVPVFRSHSVAVTVRFAKPVDPAAARAVLEQAPGVRVVDDPRNLVFPTPLDTTNGDDCLVGRIRRDLACGDHAIALWVVGDQVRKGAALNAVQIAELLLRGKA